MFVPPVPPPLPDLGQHPFRFTPPIRGASDTEWIYGQTRWNDVQFIDTKTGQEAWIPRRFLGAVSFSDAGNATVSLMKELELRGGLVAPVQPRVVEMPSPACLPAAPPRPCSGPASVVSIRLERDSENRAGRLLLASLAVGLVGCVTLVSFYRGEVIAAHVPYSRASRPRVDFSPADTESVIIHRLGEPSSARWESARDGQTVRVLAYPARGVSIVLAGPDPNRLHYSATRSLPRPPAARPN